MASRALAKYTINQESPGSVLPAMLKLLPRPTSARSQEVSGETLPSLKTVLSQMSESSSVSMSYHSAIPAVARSQKRKWSVLAAANGEENEFQVAASSSEDDWQINPTSWQKKPRQSDFAWQGGRHGWETITQSFSPTAWLPSRPHSPLLDFSPGMQSTISRSSHASKTSTFTRSTLDTSFPATPSDIVNMSQEVEAMNCSEIQDFMNDETDGQAEDGIQKIPLGVWKHYLEDVEYTNQNSLEARRLATNGGKNSVAFERPALKSAHLGGYEEIEIPMNSDMQSRSFKFLLLPDLLSSCMIKLDLGQTNEAITGQVRIALDLPWNQTISFEDKWGRKIKPHPDLFWYTDIIHVRPGPKVSLAAQRQTAQQSLDLETVTHQNIVGSKVHEWCTSSHFSESEDQKAGAPGTPARSCQCANRSSSEESPIDSEGEASFAGSIDSDEVAEEWEASLGANLRLLRVKLVDQLVASFRGIYIDTTEVPCDNDSSSSSSQQTSDSTTSSGDATKSSATSFGKRRLDEDDESNESNLQDTPDRKKRRTREAVISSNGRLLACPYCKFDPIRYSELNIAEKHYRGCSSSFLTTISRLKQHLYRVHKRPEHHCVSCYTVFGSKALLDAHTRARPPCDLMDTPFGEKMNFEQFSLIKRRVVGQNPADTWYAIYDILFSGRPRPESPYADGVSSEMARNFVDHFNRQARARLLALIRTELNGTLLMERDQERILDSALETSIAQLVSVSDLLAGYEIYSPLGVSETASLQIQEFSPSSPRLPQNFLASLRSKPSLAQQGPSDCQTALREPHRTADEHNTDDLFYSYDPTLTNLDFSLPDPDLPENIFFN
jgi:hypothetical protein